MSQLNPNRTVDPETLLPCPYDETHMIRVLRWPRHIIKCRKNHPMEDLRCCPFNARHEVPSVELRHHIATCPDQIVIHQEILHEARRRGELEDVMKGNTDVPPYDHNWSSFSAEDWDAEYRRDPVQVAPALTNTSVSSIDRSGLTPSQRREYRKLLKQLSEVNAESQRATEIRAQIRALASTGSGTGSLAQTSLTRSVEKAASEGVRVRMPHGPPQVDTVRKMNGVVKPDQAEPTKSSRVAANFNYSGLGRGGRPAGAGPAPAPGTSQIDQRYEILVKLAAGRGVPKPKMPSSHY